MTQHTPTLYDLSHDKIAIAVIGLYHTLPIHISTEIGFNVVRGMVNRDIKRCDDMIETLTEIQIHPEIYCWPYHDSDFNKENIRIRALIDEIECNIKSYEIRLTHNSDFGHIYTIVWKLVGPFDYHDSSQMRSCAIETPSSSDNVSHWQKRTLCEDGEENYLIDYEQKKQLLCNISNNGWDGLTPGEYSWDELNYPVGTLPSPGWFAGEIAFLQQLKQLLC